MKCCEQYAAALSAFVDGELSENEKEEVLSHVEHCQNCREYLSELMIVHTMFEEMPSSTRRRAFPSACSSGCMRKSARDRATAVHGRACWPRALRCLSSRPRRGSWRPRRSAATTAPRTAIPAAMARRVRPLRPATRRRTLPTAIPPCRRRACRPTPARSTPMTRKTAQTTAPPTQTAAMPSSRWMCPRRRNFCTSAAWPCTRKMTSTSATSSWPKRHMT